MAFHVHWSYNRAKQGQKGDSIEMEIEKLDITGMQFSQAISKIAAKTTSMKQGDVLEIVGNRSTFEEQILIWCERVRKKILCIKSEGKEITRCQIQF